MLVHVLRFYRSIVGDSTIGVYGCGAVRYHYIILPLGVPAFAPIDSWRIVRRGPHDLEVLLLFQTPPKHDAIRKREFQCVS